MTATVEQNVRTTSNAEPLLIAEGVTKVFGGLTAVDRIDLRIERGSIFGVIGPNGAGKTTFFNMIAGIYQPTSGHIIFDGQPMHSSSGGMFRKGKGLRPDQVAASGIARTFQNIRLFGNMTALENVLIGMHCRLHSSPLGAVFHSNGFRREEAMAFATSRDILDYVGIGKVRDELAKNLSYGDQRRLEIARALASEPKLLLLDEPTAGMNPHETASMTTFINRLRHDRELTILLIEHDMKVVMGISDQIAVLDHGVKIADGTPVEVRRNPLVIEAYLGRGASGASTDAGA